MSDVRAWGIVGSGVWILTGVGDLVIGRDPRSGWHVAHAWSGRPLAVAQVGEAGWMVVVRSPASTTDADGLDLALILEVYRSEDDGQTWRSAVIGGDVAGTTPSLSFWSPEEGMLVLGAIRHSTGRSLLTQTADIGATWTTPVGITDPWLIGPAAFRSPSRGWVAGVADRQVPATARDLFETNHGGRSWSAVRLPIPAGFSASDRTETGAPVRSGNGIERLLVAYGSGDRGVVLAAGSGDGVLWQTTGLLAGIVPALVDASQVPGLIAAPRDRRLRSTSRKTMGRPGHPGMLEISFPVQSPFGSVRPITVGRS